MARQTLTPPQLAERWGIQAHKVLDFIYSGELRAFDLARRGSSRPRFHVPLDAVEAFERSREVVPQPEPAPRVRKRRDPAIKEFV